MSVDRPQSPEESLNAKRPSVCQWKRCLKKKNFGHEAQPDINRPSSQKNRRKKKEIKIRKSLRWNIKWRRVEYSMLVMFDSFDDFFAILCSVIRKVLQRRKNVPWRPRYRWDSRLMPWKKQFWNPRATPPLTCGQDRPTKDLVNEPVVLKANGRYFNSRLFNIRLKHRNRVCTSSPRGCRLVLLSEAAEVFWAQ